MTEAQGLLIFPAEATRLAEGQTAQVQVLDPGVLSPASSGV
jgi:hypothetical protein